MLVKRALSTYQEPGHIQALVLECWTQHKRAANCLAGQVVAIDRMILYFGMLLLPSPLWFIHISVISMILCTVLVQMALFTFASYM